MRRPFALANRTEFCLPCCFSPVPSNLIGKDGPTRLFQIDKISSTTLALFSNIVIDCDVIKLNQIKSNKLRDLFDKTILVVNDDCHLILYSCIEISIYKMTKTSELLTRVHSLQGLEITEFAAPCERLDVKITISKKRRRGKCNL